MLLLLYYTPLSNKRLCLIDVPQNNCSKILQNSEHSINSSSFLINIEKFAQSWDSDIEVETKKTWISKQPRHINGWTGYSAF